MICECGCTIDTDKSYALHVFAIICTCGRRYEFDNRVIKYMLVTKAADIGLARVKDMDI